MCSLVIPELFIPERNRVRLFKKFRIQIKYHLFKHILELKSIQQILAKSTDCKLITYLPVYIL
jgi:hypothetical protein